MTRTAAALLASFLIALPLPAQAEQARDFGDYVIHYNALTTDFLAPEVARDYGIRRSKHRGLVNISVQKKTAAAAGDPVAARVKVRHARIIFFAFPDLIPATARHPKKTQKRKAIRRNLAERRP